jgi:hypothetical protein
MIQRQYRRRAVPGVEALDPRQLLSTGFLPVHGPVVGHHDASPSHGPAASERFHGTAGSVIRTAQSTTAILD